MLVYEYKLDGTPAQLARIDEAIRVVQFVRNKCLRKWMDEHAITANDLQAYCAVLAKDFAFATALNSQARQASADRAWLAISERNAWGQAASTCSGASYRMRAGC